MFPDLSRDQIRDASAASVGAWDSIASVTLLMLVQEEFGVVADMERFEEFTSYRGLLEYVREACPDG
ncbi:MAG TPA: acyl carrier protein [Bryobacteraceae bacterium]|nr:acyl carrier protein [Bryobacteraceae bacterium]